jgi:hypothetical protein
VTAFVDAAPCVVWRSAWPVSWLLLAAYLEVVHVIVGVVPGKVLQPFLQVSARALVFFGTTSVAEASKSECLSRLAARPQSGRHVSASCM